MTDHMQITYFLRLNHIRITSRKPKLGQEVTSLQEHGFEIKPVVG